MAQPALQPSRPQNGRAAGALNWLRALRHLLTEHKLIGPVWKRFRKHRAALIGAYFLLFLVVLAIFAPLFAPYHPTRGNFSEARQAPSWKHWMGTDETGRDVLSRVIFGTQLSLAVGVVSVAIALTIGTILGCVAGYFGGWWDQIIMRVMDILLAFPSILLALAFMLVFGRGLDKAMIAIGIVSMPSYARIVRASVLSVREQDFVTAARAAGLPVPRIIFRHVLPNVLAPIIVRATLGVSEAILEAAALGFLGLGAQVPQPEWGAMLSGSRNYVLTAPWLVVFPGMAISLTVLAFNLVGDGLRDALDPRLKT